MIAAITGYIRVGQNNHYPLTPKLNERKDKRCWVVIKDWVGDKQEAFYRIMKAITLSLKISREAGVSGLDGKITTFDTITKSTLWFRLPSLWEDAIRSVSDFMGKHHDDYIPGIGVRRVEKAVGDLAEAISATSTCSEVILSSVAPALCPAVRSVATITGCTSDITDSIISVDNLKHTNRALHDIEGSSRSFKNVLKENQRRNMILVVKTVCAAVGSVFGVLALATGAALAPAIILLSIALVSTLAAITAKVYEGTMTSKPIDWFDKDQIGKSVVISL
jgi:hypothetical protein